MGFRFLEPEDPLWRIRLNSVSHDFYHNPRYVRLAARTEGAGGVAAYVENGVDWILAPIIKRPISMDCYDAISPYGYSGVLGDSNLLPALLKHLEITGCVSIFLRYHPIYNADLGETIGKTVVIDLAKPIEQLVHETRKGHRQDIARLEKTDFHASIDEAWDYFDSFFKIYENTMKRLGARKGYFFCRDYFLELRHALEGKLHLCVVQKEGVVTAAGLFSEVDGVVQFHLAGTHESFLKNAPSKLMLSFMRQWAKLRGNRWFHLGGGVGGCEDSLFDFKSGFSKEFCDFRVGRYILNQAKYDELVLQNSKESLTTFFPAYRS